MIRENPKRKIVVVGAGLSGLTAARQILQDNPDMQIELTVLEALDRVGGRTCTVDINGFKFDEGAEFIGKTQAHVIALAEESGNQLYNLYHKGTKIIQVDNTRYTYQSDIPNNLSIWGLIQLQVAIWKLNAMSKKVSTLDPKDCDLGYLWDSMSVQTWLDQNISHQRVKVMFQIACRTIYGADPCEMSFLFFLWYTRQNGDIDNLINAKNGLQEMKTKLGTQHFSKFLAEKVEEKGGVIKCGVKVCEIKQIQAKCVVRCQDNTVYECDFLVMACAPWQANKIIYSPPLSSQRKVICQRSFMGSYIKVILLYKKAYWREKNFSGEIMTDCQNSPLLVAYDDTKTNDKGEIQPAMIVFVGGQLHKYWKQRGDLQKELVKKIAELMKEPEMLNPIRVWWKTWEDEETIGGGPTGIFGPGILTQISDLRKPEGKIHWAGTELASVSTGYMDGAIQSGKRVAIEVSAQMKGEYVQLSEKSREEKGFWYTKYLRGIRKWVEWL